MENSRVGDTNALGNKFSNSEPSRIAGSGANSGSKKSELSGDFEPSASSFGSFHFSANAVAFVPSWLRKPQGAEQSFAAAAG